MDRATQHLFLRNPKREDNFREVEKRIIYSDIDEVLHDYRKPFFKELKNRYNIDVSVSSIPGEYDLKKPLISTYGIPELEFEDLIEHVNGFTEWVPTLFSKDIVNFLKIRKEKGDTILFITARTSRRGARHIIREAFGEDIPIIQCDSQYKKHVIKDHSIFFEDRGDTIEYCSEKNKNSLIIVPEWPWNSYLKDRNLNNVRVCPQNDFETFLNEIDVLLDSCEEIGEQNE